MVGILLSIATTFLPRFDPKLVIYSSSHLLIEDLEKYVLKLFQNT